jgi:hypothetical protein
LSHRSTVAEQSLHGRMRTEEVLKVEQDKAQLEEVRQALAMSERSMIRRWACQRAAYAIVAIFTVMAACGAASWYLANTFAPAKVAATVTLEAKNLTRTPMSSAQADSWRTWHTQLLNDPMFHQSVVKRLAERRLERGSNSAAIATRIADDLTVDTWQNGRMTLTLAGTDRDELTAVLDVIAGTLAMESNRQADNRADATPAIILGERREGGVIRYAGINPVAISDGRLAVGGPIFAVMLAGCIALFMMMYRRLSRAQSVFENENAALMLE